MKWIILSSVAVAFCGIYLLKRNHNNVCKTFSDYYTDRDNNENCYYNPDASLTVDGIIKRHGYPVQIYNTTTEDGYIITMFRIPHGKANTTNTEAKPKQPVFLSHGIGHNSESFINTGKKSLGFILADAGYDVWLGNFRGTIYSRNHLNLSITDLKFWDFTYHEMGIYDIAAQVDLISDFTKQKVIYIGYSLGSVTAFIYGSTYPEIAKQKIKSFVCLAPASFMGGWKSLTRYVFPLWPYVKPIVEWFTHGLVYLRLPPNQVRNFLCLPYPFLMNICQVSDMLVWGFNYNQSDPETLPVTLIQNSDATSTKTISHMIQLVNNGGKFDQFDYGTNLNRRIYGTSDPPIYDLSKFRVPVYLTRGENDLLVTEEDVKRLNASLPERVKSYDVYIVKDNNFNHGDFVVAKDVVPLLYDPVLKYLRTL